MADQVAQVALGAALATTLHPIAYAKTLIQLGYEPLPPASYHGIFGGSYTYYPNVFRYVGHIYSTDGFFGLYRGLFPRVLSATLSSSVTAAVQRKLSVSSKCSHSDVADEIGSRSKCNDCASDEHHSRKCDVIKLVRETGYEITSRSVGIIVSYPFSVIMVRSMAQFVGRETKYNTIMGALQEILDNEGVPGFFKGLVPRLIGEALSVCLANLLTFVVNTYVVSDNKSLEHVKSYVAVICSLITSQATYPFLLVANVMSVNNSSLKVAKPPLSPEPYKSWLDCLRRLADNNQLKRGSTMFYRAYVVAPLI